MAYVICIPAGEAPADGNQIEIPAGSYLRRDDGGAPTVMTDLPAGEYDAFVAVLLEEDVVVTGDETAPTLLSTSPVDDATDVAVDVHPTITFDEDIAFGSGNIVLREYDGDSWSDLETFDVESDVGGGAGTVSISGAVLTIEPTSELSGETEYAIRIASTAIEDLSGNPFAGIADDTTVSFTTADETAPTLLSTSPADDATGVAVGSAIDLVFSEAIALGTGDIVLREDEGSGFAALETFDAATGDGDNGGTLTVVTTNVANDTLRITPGEALAYGTDYAIRVGATAIEDASGNAFAGIDDDTTLNFTTAEEVEASIAFTQTLYGTSTPQTFNDVDLGAHSAGRTSVVIGGGQRLTNQTIAVTTPGLDPEVTWSDAQVDGLNTSRFASASHSDSAIPGTSGSITITNAASTGSCTFSVWAVEGLEFVDVAGALEDSNDQTPVVVDEVVVPAGWGVIAHGNRTFSGIAAVDGDEEPVTGLVDGDWHNAPGDSGAYWAWINTRGSSVTLTLTATNSGGNRAQKVLTVSRWQPKA